LCLCPADLLGWWRCAGCDRCAVWPLSQLNIWSAQCKPCHTCREFCIHLAFLWPGHLCWPKGNKRASLVGGLLSWCYVCTTPKKCSWRWVWQRTK
jgi:hypothetical protein